MSETTEQQNERDQHGWRPGLNTNTPASPTGHSLIGPSVVIRGEVIAEEDLLVRGRIEGFIDHSATVTVHAEGTVAAEVKAQEVLVEGTVDGNVYGIQRVQIAESGKVNGNVYSPRVGVLEGASFKGAIDMDSDVEAIERRFREQTGTEMKPQPKAEQPKAEKPSAEAKGDSDKEEEKTDAAKVDGEGRADESAASTGKAD